MVSRKINELQLQREQPERWRLPALPPAQRQGRALPIPSPASGPPLLHTTHGDPRGSCCSHRCARCASGMQPTQAPCPSPQHRCISQPLQVGLGPGWRSADTAGQGALRRGRSGSHGDPEPSSIWMTARCKRKQRAACPTLSPSSC